MCFSSEYCGFNTINGTQMKEIVNNFIDSGGTVIGLFHGHNHWDYIGDNGKFKEVSTGCALLSNETSETMPSGAVVPSRVKGTSSEMLFDIVVVKPESRTVKMIRFGAGDDREFTYWFN